MFNRKSILLINDFFAYYTNLHLIETEFTNPFSNIKVFFFLRTLRFYINLLIKISFVFKKLITKNNDYDIRFLNMKSIEYSRKLLMS